MRSVGAFSVALCLGALGPLLFSCVRTPAPSLLRVGVLNAPKSLKSFELRDGASLLVGHQVHRGLVRFDPQSGNFVPAAARQWSVGSDGRSIVFRLDTRLRFHNGEPLSCAAAKASFDRLLSLRGSLPITLPPQVQFQCLDPSTLVLKTNHLPALLLDNLAAPAAAISLIRDPTVGLGPYALREKNNLKITLTKASPLSPGPDAIEFQVDSAEGLQRRYIRNELDDLLYVGLFQEPSSDELKNCQRLSGVSPTSFWLSLNARHPLLSSRQKRKQWSLLIQEALRISHPFSNELTQGSLIPYGLYGEPPAVQKDSLVDLKSIRNELAEATRSQGRLRLTLRRAMKDQYRWRDFFRTLDPGGQLFAIEFVDNAEFFARYYRRDLDIFLLGTNVTHNDPFEVLQFFRAGDSVNPSGVKERTMDNWVGEAAQFSTTHEVRLLARKAAAWVVEEAYAVPLFTKRFTGCVRPTLTGYQLTPQGPLAMDYSQVGWQ